MNEITNNYKKKIYEIFGDMPMLSHNTPLRHFINITNTKYITSGKKNNKKYYAEGVESRALPYIYFSTLNYQYVQYLKYLSKYHITIIFPVDILKNKPFFHSVKWGVYPEEHGIHYKTIQPIKKYINETLKNIRASYKKNFYFENEILIQDDVPLKDAIMIVLSKELHIDFIKTNKNLMKYALEWKIALIKFCDTHNIIRVYR